MIKGVIFDWAGTTVDFGCFAPLRVFVDIFEAHGISITIEEARAPMGMSKKDHVRAILEMERVSGLWKERFGRAWTESDVEQVYAGFEPALMENLHEYTDVLDGVIAACAYLREKGIKIGSTTGYTKEMMKVVKEGAAKNGYQPDVVVTAEDAGGKGRPFPNMIQKNMELLEIENPAEILKVGDTVADIKEGLNAGVHCAGVIVGSSIMGLAREVYEEMSPREKDSVCAQTQAVFAEAGAAYTIQTMEGLPALIEKINKESGEESK